MEDLAEYHWKGRNNIMNDAVKEIISTIVYLAVIFVLTFLFITFVAQRTEVSGSSMEPTLQDADSLIVDKLSYRFRDPERFEIVIFPYQYGDKQYFIKRVIGLPGEEVQIDLDGNIYINGELLSEQYGAEIIIDPGRAIEPVVLGENEYFVMGDNRNHSMDSRDPAVGNINKKDLLGKALFRIFPFSSFGGIK